MPRSLSVSVPPPPSPVQGGRRLLMGLAALLALTGLGAAGYAAIEGLRFADALYMTVITLSTVGYHEVVPLSPLGRWYTIALIVVGVGTVFFMGASVAQYVIEGQLRNLLGRRAMQRSIDALREHVIVCGFGRLGRSVAERLEGDGTPCVVVDPDPTAQADCDARGYRFVLGSALDDDVLAAAGLARARAIVAAMPSDSDNVFVSLSAREANPDILIHARAETPEGTRRLRLAGASQVISPHQLGGQRIANAIVRPGVVEFLELSAPGAGAEIDLEEVVVPSGSGAANLSVGELRARGVRVSVVAIKRAGAPILLDPEPEETLEAGDRVIAVGSRENLRRLAALAQPR